MNALLYYRTLRSLDPGQIGYRTVAVVRRRLGLARSLSVRGHLAVGPFGDLRRAFCDGWSPPAEDVLATAEAVLAGEFRFIGEQRRLGRVDWGERYGSPLWSFHLQYGSYVEDLAWAFEFTKHAPFLRCLSDLVLSWVAAPKPVTGDAWAPYAVSRRLIHWTRAFLLCAHELPHETRAVWLRSLMQQTTYLSANVEWHLQGNHVIKNLAAVFCASAIFDGPAAASLQARVGRALIRQVSQQLLPDGMHYERSPMYHADVLADLRLVSAIAAVMATVRDECSAVSTALVPVLASMQEVLARVVRPDGSMHLLNDAANDPRLRPGRSVPVGAVPVSTGVWSLPSAGYYGGAGGRLRFIIDCGDLGPQHQPAHGHCDLLSFELDIDGVPLIVDSGTSGYEGDPLREYVRSTRAHNTVQIGEREQHEMWGTFRVARRAQVYGAEMTAQRFSGSYSPYYSKSLTHARVITWTPAEFEVEDMVHGTEGAPIRSFLHLYPGTKVAVDEGCVAVELGKVGAHIDIGNIAAVRVVEGDVERPQGWYAPELGCRLAAPVLELTVADSSAPFGYRIRAANGVPG